MPKSMILKRVMPRIIPNIVVAVITTVMYEGVSEFFSNGQTISVSTLPHTFVATVMSLLLVFRTNAAYDRFWEARKLWGRLVNVSRAFARLTAVALPRDHARLVATLEVMFPYALMHHLQSRREAEPFATLVRSMKVPEELRPPPSRIARVVPGSNAIELENGVHTDIASATTATQVDEAPSAYASKRILLAPKRIAARINGATNKPLEVIVQLGTAVRVAMGYKERKDTIANGGFPSMTISVERQMLEQMMSDLIDIQGACERIVKTPVPLSWSRHTSRLLTIWSLTLPLVLVPLEGIMCIPTVAVISWAIFSIEEIAHILEDPFLMQRYSLPLDTLCETIENDVLQQLVV